MHEEERKKPRRQASTVGPNRGGRVDGLSNRQEKALAALIVETSIEKASVACGIPQRTIYQWLERPEFSMAYRRARREAFAHAMSIAQRYSPHAIQTLVKIMADNSTASASRVAAATALLKFSRDSIELDDLSQRIEALERDIKIREEEPPQEPMDTEWRELDDENKTPSKALPRPPIHPKGNGKGNEDESDKDNDTTNADSNAKDRGPPVRTRAQEKGPERTRPAPKVTSTSRVYGSGRGPLRPLGEMLGYRYDEDGKPIDEPPEDQDQSSSP
ncbi:MAG: hypothetical protein AB7Q00_08775 [Phycisphaerales bacterium]